MDEHPDIDSIRHLTARRAMLEEQLHSMENQILGRDNSFFPFISNKDGVISERKLAQFINRLVDGVLDRNENKDYRELCKCFLYCAIKGIAKYNECDKHPVVNADFFSDITDLAKHRNNLHLTDIDTLLEYEFQASMHDCVPGVRTYWDEFNDGGFFRNSDMAYLLLTGKHIISEFPKDKYREIQAFYELEEAKANGFDSAEEYQNYTDASSSSMNKELERIAADELPENTEFADIDDWEENNVEVIKKQTETSKKWVEEFSNPEIFVKKYLRFRELFFELDMYYRCRLFEDIERMVDLFLYKSGLSCLSENDRFAMIYYRTNKLCAAVKHIAVRRSDKS